MSIQGPPLPMAQPHHPTGQEPSASSPSRLAAKPTTTGQESGVCPGKGIQQEINRSSVGEQLIVYVESFKE